MLSPCSSYYSNLVCLQTSQVHITTALVKQKS